MPATLRNVAKTDTLETQRQKINQIAEDVYSIASGGSDLSTGNLKLGDGTRTTPSLSFNSDSTLGIYKAANNTFGFVSGGKKIADYSQSAVYTFKDLIIQQKILTNSGLSFLNSGSNYDPGSYSNISFIGGTGENATASISVTEFDGVVNSYGDDYIEGAYSNIPLTGGSGSGASASFSVEGIQGFSRNQGSGYIPGTYPSVPLTGGTGSGATANLVISGDTILNGNITNSGSGYTTGIYNNVPFYNVPLQTFTVSVVSNPNTPPPDNVFQIDGNTQQQLTLVKGNTYRFDISDSSNTGHPLIFESSPGTSLDSDYYSIVQRGFEGITGSFIDLVINPNAPTETIIYNCSVHNGMGANISVVPGTSGNYGNGGFGSIEINPSGNVSLVSFTTNGSDYVLGNTLQIISDDVGTTGSGFLYTLTSPTYTGIVSSIVIEDNGTGYLNGDLLSFNSSSVGGVGSGFEFEVDNDPLIISNFEFTSKGSGYQENDILELPQTISNVSSNLNGQVSNLSTTLDSSSPIVIVSDTTGILEGMNVFNGVSDLGVVASGTTVLSVDSSTEITLSQNPDVSGSASLTFRSPDSLSEIQVASVSGILPNSIVTKVSGTGVLAANTTVFAVDPLTNIVTLSIQPDIAGSVVLDFTPPFGDGSLTSSFEYEINSLGVIDSVSLSSGGNGYSLLDQLTVNPSDLTQPIIYPVKNNSCYSVTFVETVSSSAISVGDFLKVKYGSIVRFTSTTVTSTGSSGVYTNVSTTTSGSGIGLTFDVERDNTGTITSILISTNGFFYAINDTVTISGDLVGGTAITDDITITIDEVSITSDLEIYEIITSGSNVSSILIEAPQQPLFENNILVESGTTSPEFTISTISQLKYKFFIDIGNGFELTPNITFYSGNRYQFDLSDSSNIGHVFSLSEYRDGIWGPSYIQNIDTVLETTSNDITVSSSSGILPGMVVSVIGGTGALVANTSVDSVNGNVITLSSAPSTSGNATLSFRGIEYTDGVTKNSTSLSILVNDNTPSLYYYCATSSDSHVDEGGDDFQEALISIDLNNLRVFGSGFLLSVSSLNSSDVITADIETGDLTAVKFIGQQAELGQISVTGTLTAPLITGNTITATTISSSGNLGLSASAINVTGNFNVGSTIQVVNSSGNITTSGILKTTNSLNINDRLTVTDNTISSATGNNIILSPATGRVAKINTTSAITIPAGTTAQRPTSGIVESGSIRFNTDTGQYEGYSASTSSWSSLGGVRDLDGNTYITAEASIGANDNTLYFYNDGNNTVNITPTELVFNTVKTISSPNPLNPPSTQWIANTPVTLGSYIYWVGNLYEVTIAGTTSTIGNEPTHITGSQVNGTATLTWYSSFSGDITFSQVSNVKINNNLTFYNDSVGVYDLRLFDNKISSNLSDIIIEPFAGKKLDINTNTSLVLPNGTTAERGIPGQGSVRFNTSLSQFEGYNGTNWTSLGGVRDVDGNTYIVPETAPGANENILYFYNNGSNTLRLTENELTFNTIDQIGSTANNLDIQAPTVTFNSLALTIDTSAVSTTKLLSTKTNIDFAISSGLNTDPLIRLNSNGDIYVNQSYGTGSNAFIKVLDNELNKFELDDVITETSEYVLEKGATENGASVIFTPSLHSGAKVIIIADNTSVDDREMIEFTVVAKGTDIYHTEYGNVRSGDDLISPSFDFDAQGNVRLNASLVSSVASGDIINVTVVSTVIKK